MCLKVFTKSAAIIVSFSLIAASFPRHADGQGFLSPPYIKIDIERSARTLSAETPTAKDYNTFALSCKAYAFDEAALGEGNSPSEETQKKLAGLLRSGRYVIVFSGKKEGGFNPWIKNMLRDRRLVNPEKRPLFFAVEEGSAKIYQGTVEQGLLNNVAGTVEFSGSADKNEILGAAKKAAIKRILQMIGISAEQMIYTADIAAGLKVAETGVWCLNVGSEKQLQNQHVVNALREGTEEVHAFIDKTLKIINDNAETQNRWNQWWAQLKNKGPVDIRRTLKNLYNQAQKDCESGAGGRYVVPVWALSYLKENGGFAFVMSKLNILPKKSRSQFAEFLEDRKLHIVFELVLTENTDLAEPKVQFHGFVCEPIYENEIRFKMYGGSDMTQPININEKLPLIRNDIRPDRLFNERGFIEPVHQILSLLKLGYYFGPLRDADAEDISWNI